MPIRGCIIEWKKSSVLDLGVVIDTLILLCYREKLIINLERSLIDFLDGKSVYLTLFLKIADLPLLTRKNTIKS